MGLLLENCLVNVSCYLLPWAEPARVKREMSSVSTHGDFSQCSEIACVMVVHKQAEAAGL